MVASGWIIGLGLLGFTSTPSAADAVTLRDGKVVLGQVVESTDRRGPLIVLVRRAWVEANLPDRAASWAKLEAPITRRAEAQRRERLLAWRAERRPDPAGGDRITPWIDRELARPADPNGTAKSPLMVARIGRTEVKSIDRKSRKDNRMLRLGWLSNLPDVETLSRADLAQALDGRGFSAEAETPVSVEALLPLQPETEAQWLVRRAATEIINDSGGRLLRYQGMVLPEPGAGEAPPAGASLEAALGMIQGLLGEAPTDPLPGKLRELAGQGRTGAVVTRLELSPDLSSVAVETTLWARVGDRWTPALARTSNASPANLPANAGDGLADDPQVKAIFGLVESLGLGEVAPELKRRSLNMGASTRQALGQARTSLDLELNSLALSLEAPREASPAANPAAKP